MTRLKTSLRLREELKKPRSYEDAVDVAKRKKWKLCKMSQLGLVDLFPMEKQIRRLELVVQRVFVEVLQPVVQSIVSLVVVIPRVAVATDDGLR